MSYNQTMAGYYQDSSNLLFRKIKALKLTRFRTSFPSKRVARDRLRRSPQHPDHVNKVSNSVPGSFFYDVDEVERR